LTLNGKLQAFSATRGGSLALQANAIQLGGTRPDFGIHLAPDFFEQGGFTSYSLTGIGTRSLDGRLIPGVRLAEDTTLNLTAQSWVSSPGSPASGVLPVEARRIGMNIFLPSLLPEGVRRATSLSITATGYDDGFTEDRVEAIGIVDLKSGSNILADAGASIRIAGDMVSSGSTIQAPGGSIAISGRSAFRVASTTALNANFALPTVHLLPDAKLSVAGKIVRLADPENWTAGTIHPGGSIQVSGNILAESGSILDASGTKGHLDFPANPGDAEFVSAGQKIRNILRPVLTLVESDGGRIDVSGSQFLYVDSTLSGHKGGPGAVGGSLAVSSGRFYSASDSRTGADTNLLVAADGSADQVADTIRLATLSSGLLASGSPDGFLNDFFLSPPARSPGTGFFATDRFASGGFDFLDLGFRYFENSGPIPFGGNLEFLEPVSLSARGAIRLAGGGSLKSTFPVSISAPYVALGQEFRPPPNPADLALPFRRFDAGTGALTAFNPVPVFGPGSLLIESKAIDAGTLVSNGISSTSLLAGSGQIRGNGFFNTAGSIHLEASQIYPSTGAAFDLFAFDGGGTKGSISVVSPSKSSPSLTAGGRLSLFADSIEVEGNLSAPLGSIVIGWDGSHSSKPLNPVAGESASLPLTSKIILDETASLSVSGIDPVTGRQILVPYGISPDGLTWIDPRGVDVTVSGLPERSVVLSSESLDMAPGANIDLRGGGDLFAYRWVPGTGGSMDILGTATRTWSSGSIFNFGDLVRHGGKTWSARRDIDPALLGFAPEPSESIFWSLLPESYAILPGHQAIVSPFNLFNTGIHSGGLQGDPGFLSPGLRFGEAIQLSGVSGLADGDYTLLPRRYALLPGAYLVTPLEGILSGTGAVRTTRSSSAGPAPEITTEEGSNRVWGIVKNGLASNGGANSAATLFEVSPSSVFSKKSDFQIYRANPFLSAAAARLGLGEAQTLPRDSSQLRIHSNATPSLQGAVLASPGSGGRGAAIDLSSISPISITDDGAGGSLKTSVLNSWNAASLLIGGWRADQAGDTKISVRTDTIILDAPSLRAGEVLLASKSGISVADGSSIIATGTSGDSEKIVVDGDGTLVVVSPDELSISRPSPQGTNSASLQIGADTLLSGSSVVLDSTRSSVIDPSLKIESRNLELGAGQISLVFNTPAGGLTGSAFPTHLVLEGQFLRDALEAETLTLRSYSSIDLYSSASVNADGNSIAFLSSGLRGYSSPGSTIEITAKDVLFSNPNSAPGLASPASQSGTLALNAQNVRFGENAFSVSGFQNMAVGASAGAASVADGSFSTTAQLLLATPSLTAAKATSHALSSAGSLQLSKSPGASTNAAGLGASLSLSGTSVQIGTDILLPSGSLGVTASSGSILVTGTLSAAGAANTFFDVTRHTDGGDIELKAAAGSVELADGSLVSVAAPSGGGNAGRLVIHSPAGVFSNNGELSGNGGTNGKDGMFVLDARSVDAFDTLTESLQLGGFTEFVDFRIRTGDITMDRDATFRNFLLSADAGSITVNRKVDASGETGGRIELVARNNLTLSPGATVTVAAERFANSGKGGHVHLEAGSAINGAPNTAALLDLQSGSLIDLSVEDFTPGDHQAPGSSAFLGKFEGTLHLRAPRLGNDVRLDPIESTISGGSAVTVEPFRVYEPTGGVMNIALRNSIHSDNTAFMNAGEVSILARLGGNLGGKLLITPGVEILNRTEDLALGLANPSGSTNAEALSGADWDLSGFRYGANSAPGVLTLRAAGDLVFNNTLSDGFNPIAQGSAANFADIGHSQMWLATPQAINANLPVNRQSWSYRLAAGSDMSSTSHRGTLSADLPAGKGSVLVGEFYPAVPNTANTGPSAGVGSLGQTADTIRISNTTTNRGTRFEVVRTGTGDIDLAAARDVQLRNPFATIYTSGVALPTPTRIFQDGDFSLPIVVRPSNHPDQGNLGAVQQAYNPSYTMAGGTVSISAGRDIGRFTQSGGAVVPDASRQLPTNWLYRRGQVDASTGLFTTGGVGSGGLGTFTDSSASTTWWVDFSNYFGGFGALGGGSVSLFAGNDLINADAAVPTNARMAGLSGGQRIAPSMQNLQELGGGDLSLSAGRNIDGGFFHAEKGAAFLDAGGQVTTNSAQSPSRGLMGTSGQQPLVYGELTWQPVTLFGSGSQFTVTARGDVLLGPVTNAFLLPQGLNNKFWYKTQFNTIDSSAGAAVTSFGGSITHRLAITLPGDSMAIPVLEAAYRQSSAISPIAAGFFRPWLRLSELNSSNFRTAATISLPSLKSTAHGGDVNVTGTLNLFPSPEGKLELLAAGQISGLNPSGTTTTTLNGINVNTTAWITSKINLSDADPAGLPRILAPYSIQAALDSRISNTLRDTPLNPFASLDRSFAETGAFTGAAGAIDIKSALHRSSPIHSENADPLRLYAGGGDLTGLTLYSGKRIMAHAERDIADIAFYLQHAGGSDVSILSAGRDIVPFNENSTLRAIASDSSLGNTLIDEPMDTVVDDASGNPVKTRALPGDIQIGGRGVLEVLAGRNVDLGTGPNLVDGRGKGITSIGR